MPNQVKKTRQQHWRVFTSQNSITCRVGASELLSYYDNDPLHTSATGFCTNDAEQIKSGVRGLSSLLWNPH